VSRSVAGYIAPGDVGLSDSDGGSQRSMSVRGQSSQLMLEV
jgi:hypothetical protein